MAKATYIIISWLHDLGFLGIILVNVLEILKLVKEPIFIVVFLIWGYYKIQNERIKYKNSKNEKDDKIHKGEL